MNTRKMPEKFTNRELGMLINEMSRSIDTMSEENIKSHATLDTNQKVTNGQVKNLQLWRAYLVGAWAVLSMATPLAWYLIDQSLDNFSKSVDVKIKDGVDQAFNNRFDKLETK